MSCQISIVNEWPYILRCQSCWIYVNLISLYKPLNIESITNAISCVFEYFLWVMCFNTDLSWKKNAALFLLLIILKLKKASLTSNPKKAKWCVFCLFLKYFIFHCRKRGHNFYLDLGSYVLNHVCHFCWLCIMQLVLKSINCLLLGYGCYLVENDIFVPILSFYTCSYLWDNITCCFHCLILQHTFNLLLLYTYIQVLILIVHVSCG